MPAQQRRSPTHEASTSSESGTSTATGTASAGNAAHPANARNENRDNPGTYTDSDGDSTTHAELNMAGDASGAALMDTVGRSVRVLHPKEDPLEGCPADEYELYEERPDTGTSELGEGPGWEPVDRQIGTLSAPAVKPRVEPGIIYIGGVPQVDDIIQGAIGDCYFLAALSAITQADASFLQNEFIDPQGEQVTFNFQAYDEDSDTFSDAPVTVDKTLLHYENDDGSPGNIVGASARKGETPVHENWFAQAKSSALFVAQSHFYEVALWVPLLEKAYARFVEQHGQYGGYAPDTGHDLTDEDGDALSGYEVIEGGFEDLCYPMFYGADVSDTDTTDITYNPGADAVAGNLGAIRNLLRLGGDGLADDERFMMTASIDSDNAIDRLGALLDNILGGREIRRYPRFAEELRYMRQLTRNDANARDGDDDDLKKKQRDLVTNSASHMRKPGEWPILHRADAHKSFRDLNEMLNVVGEIGTDSSPGQRFTYANHAYTVLGSTFKNAEGNVLDVTLDNLGDTAAQIDATRSKVRLRNPHGTNSPDEHGTIDDDTDTGRFELSLDQFLRVFDEQAIATVTT